MALSFLDNIDYRGKKPSFTRDLFATIADMAAYNENYLPDVYITTCSEDGNVYVFNRTNTVDATTGKWRVLNSVVIDPEEDNLIQYSEKGLYVPSLDNKEQQDKILEIIKDNIETEDLDFSDFFN